MGATSCHFLRHPSASFLYVSSFTPLSKLMEEVYYGIHFTDGATEGWRSKVASPRHSQLSSQASHCTGPMPKFLCPPTRCNYLSKTLTPSAANNMWICDHMELGVDPRVLGAWGRTQRGDGLQEAEGHLVEWGKWGRTGRGTKSSGPGEPARHSEP